MIGRGGVDLKEKYSKAQKEIFPMLLKLVPKELKDRVHIDLSSGSWNYTGTICIKGRINEIKNRWKSKYIRIWQLDNLYDIARPIMEEIIEVTFEGYHDDIINRGERKEWEERVRKKLGNDFKIGYWDWRDEYKIDYKGLSANVSRDKKEYTIGISITCPLKYLRKTFDYILKLKKFLGDYYEK